MSPADDCHCGLRLVPITRGGAQAIPLFACPRCDLLPTRSADTFQWAIAEEIERWKHGSWSPADQVEPSRPYDYEKDGE